MFSTISGLMNSQIFRKKCPNESNYFPKKSFFTKVDNPTSEQLDDLHATYIERLKKLFEDHKSKYNVPESTELVIY